MSAFFDWDRFLIDVQKTWHADQAPEAFLPFLAWALSVDKWGHDWPEEAKRNSITQSYLIHAKKGTPSSIRRVFREAGLGEVIIHEQNKCKRYDGSTQYNGDFFYYGGSPTEHWALYSITFKQRLTIAQAAAARAMLKYTAPARCHLYEIHHDDIVYDGQFRYDGTYSHGVN